MPKIQTLEFKLALNAPVSEVFLAFTNALALREWFCDEAHLEPRKGGRFYFAWRQGYYAVGNIAKLVPDRKLVLTWAGRGEPDITQVEINFAARKKSTVVRVAHAGVRVGKKWKETAAEISRGWERGLENLQSVLETGRDLRFTLRPVLGVTGLAPLTPELAAQLNVPVAQGVRIDGTVSGLGAERAGLQQFDVLTAIDEHPVASWPDVAAALQDHRAGDQVPVDYYRGAEKATVTLELSARPLAEVPDTAAALAETVGQTVASTDAELAEVLRGVSDAEGAQSPAPGEWSVSDILAHLVLGERDSHAWIEKLVAGDERAFDLADGNSLLRTQATARAYGSLAALFEELKRNEAETVALLAALPDNFVSRKRSYWRLAHSALQNADHTREHQHQIEAVLARLRQPH